jgi:hypothetical protein
MQSLLISMDMGESPSRMRKGACQRGCYRTMEQNAGRLASGGNPAVISRVCRRLPELRQLGAIADSASGAIAAQVLLVCLPSTGACDNVGTTVCPDAAVMRKGFRRAAAAGAASEDPIAGPTAVTPGVAPEREPRCGHCGSTYIRSVRPRLWQRLRARFTPLRPYACWHCGWEGWLRPQRTLVAEPRGQDPSPHAGPHGVPPTPAA